MLLLFFLLLLFFFDLGTWVALDGFFLLESFNHAVASTTEEVEEGVEEGLREDDEDDEDEEEDVLEAVLDDDLLPDGEMLGTTVSVLF